MKKGTMLWVGLVWVSALALAVERGPWAIEEVNLVLQDSTRGRKVEVLLLYPKGTEPLPWVVFSPGFLFTGSAYRSWGELLASHGMATALVSYAYSCLTPTTAFWLPICSSFWTPFPRKPSGMGFALISLGWRW